MCIMRKLKTKIKPVSYLFPKCEINHVSSFFLQFLVFFLFIKIRTNILNNSGVFNIIMTSIVLWQKLIYICSFNLNTICFIKILLADNRLWCNLKISLHLPNRAPPWFQESSLTKGSSLFKIFVKDTSIRQ